MNTINMVVLDKLDKRAKLLFFDKLLAQTEEGDILKQNSTLMSKSFAMSKFK